MLALLSSCAFVPKLPAANFKYYGNIAPVGYFDPLNIASEKNVKYLREAELQHGRLAMVAAVALPMLELMNSEKLSINYLADMEFGSQLPFWYSMAILEFYRMYNGWNNPFIGDNRSTFTIGEKYQPGNLININPDIVSERRYNSELSNGRLAMLAVAHIVGSELVTGQSIF